MKRSMLSVALLATFFLGCSNDDDTMRQPSSSTEPSLSRARRSADHRFGEFEGEPPLSEGRVSDSDWLSYDEMQLMLRRDPERLRVYAAESPLRAVSSALDFLVVVRDHDAWFIEGQGWHDANVPAEAGGVGRQMVNYYDRGSWSKLPVPASVRIESVAWDGERFVFNTTGGDIRSTPRQVWLAVQDSITGRGLSEEQIEHNFRKLDGSAPLEWHSADPEPGATPSDM